MTREKTFRQILRRSLMKCGYAFLCVCAFAIPAFAGGSDLDVRPAEPMGDDSYAGRLAEENHCWSGTAPADVKPTRAIVETDPVQGPVVVPAKVGYAIWLEGAHGTLYAFCR